MKKLLLTGGGSAGHVMPNIALLPELKEHYDVYYMGTDGIERDIVKNAKIPYYTIRCTKLVRGSLLKNVALPVRFCKSIREATKGLRIVRPDIVFSKGGYVSLPVAIAAKRLHIPVISHESDLAPGLANKLIARCSKEVLTSFPETANKLKRGKFTGSPVRKELLSADKSSSLSLYGFQGNRPVLLVFGGGSGSTAINAAIRKNLFELSREYDVLHICGKGNAVQSNVNNYVQKEFEPNMGAAYAVADIIVSRAGSNTLFEITALKKRALVIPLANKRSRGDQIENAAYFERRGLIHVLPESRLAEKGALTGAVRETLADEQLNRNLQSAVFEAGNGAICHEIEKCCP